MLLAASSHGGQVTKAPRAEFNSFTVHANHVERFAMRGGVATATPVEFVQTHIKMQNPEVSSVPALVLTLKVQSGTECSLRSWVQFPAYPLLSEFHPTGIS